MIAACLENTLFAWSATGKVKPLPIERAEGVFVYEPGGKSYLDFNSQLMSVHIGHGHPKVVAAIQEQAAKLTYVWPGAATEPRALLGRRLAELCPGDIDTFFFTLGGAEANENALKIARQVTGRHKVLSRYRSYHGATYACMQLTGDPRRLPHEPAHPGVVHVLDPEPHDYRFGSTPEEITRNHLAYLEQVIDYEGGDKIAAMFIETVTGTNGVLPPPQGWLPGLRALLDRHGILLVCDEVMCGFGRTGKMFAFEHDDVLPDLVTMAKGLTSSYVPLGAVGMRRAIADHFRGEPFHGGLTYSAHPLACATACAVLDVIVDEGLVDNAASLGVVMREEMEGLEERFPHVRTTRNLGLFGIVELGSADGAPLVPYRGAHPAMAALNQAFLDEGLFTLVWAGTFFCNPPLTITEAELRDGFARIGRALTAIEGDLSTGAS